MTSTHRNPAIYAGLAGSVALLVPTRAEALSLFGQELGAGAGVPFVAGCVVGALVATGTSLVIDHVAEVRAERLHAEKVLENHAKGQAASQAPGAAQTGRLRNPRARHASAESWEQTGNIRVQRPQAAAPGAQAGPSQASSAVYGGAARKVQATARPQAPSTHAGAYQSSAQVQSRQATQRPQASAASNDYEDVASSYVRERRDSERRAQRAKGVAGVLRERFGGSRMEGLPVIERADGTVGDVGESWWDSSFDASQVTGASMHPLADFAGVDEQIVGNSAVMFTAQTAAEAQAAYQALQSERSAAAPQQQAPASPQGGARQQAAPHQQPRSYQWTDASQGYAAAQQPAPPAQPVYAQPAQPAQPAYTQPAQPSSEVKQSETAARNISERIANPAEAFPEVSDEPRWTDTQQDLWAIALEALDERIGDDILEASLEPEPVFEAPVAFAFDGDEADALDEPDGLEASTQFIPFRPQAGHPEVVDTEGYIDLIVDQEMARSTNKSVRKGYRDYLRLIDGGTNRLPRGARHMAAQA